MKRKELANGLRSNLHSMAARAHNELFRVINALDDEALIQAYNRCCLPGCGEKILDDHQFELLIRGSDDASEFWHNVADTCDEEHDAMEGGCEDSPMLACNECGGLFAVDRIRHCQECHGDFCDRCEHPFGECGGAEAEEAAP